MRKITILISVILLPVAAFAQDTTLTVTAEGRVGIGTTNPGNKLHVIGGAAFEGNYLYVRNPASPAGTQTWGIVISNSNGRFNLGQTTDTPPDRGSITTPFRIGAGAPAASLWINSAGAIGMGRSPSHPLHMGSTAHVTAGGVWTNASSRELKENIRDLTNDEAARALSQLAPKWYNYKIDESEEYLGFIAEDVPELVATSDRKGLSPMDIVALLTKVVQKQQKEIAQLRQEVNALKTK